MRLTDAKIAEVLDECREALRRAKLADDDANDFLDIASGIMRDYRDLVGEDCEVAHEVGKHFGRVEFFLSVPGPWCDPFKNGESAKTRSLKRKVSTFSTELGTSIFYLYDNGVNNVTVRAAGRRESNGILKQRTVQAALAGLVLGLLCQLLPADISSFIVDSIVSPLYSLSISILSGIMGPVIFLSLVSSIIALGDINTLNSLGTKIIVRFLLVACFLICAAIIVALAIFPVFGSSDTIIDGSAIISLLLDIFPTNIVQPFVDNDYPQLVVLGIALGTVLLMLGKQVKTLTDCLEQAKSGLSELMNYILKAAAIIPFLSIFKIAADGDLSVLVEGWRYLLGLYACYLICLPIKLIKTSRSCGIGLKTLWQTVAPVVTEAFMSGSVIVTAKSSQELVVREYGVREDFSSFWYPLAQAMLPINASVVFTIAPFYIASLYGQNISMPMIVTLFIISAELSLASPGITAGITTQLTALGLPTDYVGVFSAYSVFVRNARAGFCVSYRLFEEYEAATLLGAIETSEEDGKTVETDANEATGETE